MQRRLFVSLVVFDHKVVMLRDQAVMNRTVTKKIAFRNADYIGTLE